MGSELNVKVTERELEYRSKNYRDIKGIEQRQLFCCSCGNGLSVDSGRVYSHPILGIIQCEMFGSHGSRESEEDRQETIDKSATQKLSYLHCRAHFKTITFSLEKDDSVRLCHICGRERKNTYGCKKQDCPYEFCKSCIKRNIPKSLVDAESGKWKCFACNTQPLWKLRGACAAVMNSLPKRTKTKKVKSRDSSSDSEDNTSDLRNISYVKRSRLQESKKLNKRLKDVCDDESPVTPDEPQLATLRQNKGGKSNHGNDATKIGVKDSRVKIDIESSSEDSDSEVVTISKSKTVVKSHSEREKRNSKNDRVSTDRKSRYQKPHSRKTVVTFNTDSSSDDDNDVGVVKHFHKPKLQVGDRVATSLTIGKRKEHGSENKGTSREKMSSSRKGKIARAKDVSSGSEISLESSNDSSDDCDIKSTKDLEPSAYVKGKSGEKKKSDRSRRRKESSEDEAILKKKEDSKSLASKSSNVTSKSGKSYSKSQKTMEKDDDDNKRKHEKRKKSSVKSPGPKSFKEGKKPRREVSDGDSECDKKNRSNREKQKRKHSVTHSSSENAANRVLKSYKQTSDSSSGKEFKKSKVLRSSFVPLRRVADIDVDHTLPPTESSDKEALEKITKDQTFALKNSINNFYDEMKAAAKKLLNDIEKARKNSCMKDTMRVEEANRMILESKNVAKTFRTIVDKGDTKVTDHYEKWCEKTKVKNVLRRSSNDVEKSSESKSAKIADLSSSESSSSRKKASSINEERAKNHTSTVTNDEINVVVSECDSEEIFSDNEIRTAIEKSNLASPENNEKDENIEVSKDRETEEYSRDPDPIPDKSENIAVFSDKETSDNEATPQSPTMSEFFGLSDNDEHPAKSRRKSQDKSGSEEVVEDTDIPNESIRDNESFVEDSEKECKTDNEKSNRDNPKILKIRDTENIPNKATVPDSDSESDGSIKTKVLSPKTPPRKNSEQSDSEIPVPEKSMEIVSENTDNNEELLNAGEKDSVNLEKEGAIVTEVENRKKYVEENTFVEEKERSEVDSDMSCDIASASTIVMSPNKLSDEKDDDDNNQLVSNNADVEKSENEEETVAADNAEILKEPSSPKQPKKIDNTSRSNTVARSSSDTVFADEIENTNEEISPPKTPNEIDSGAGTDISESQNRRAREALLLSSNSDDSTSDEHDSSSQNTPKDSNDIPPTPPESDSKSEKNLDKNSSERDGVEKSRKKRSKFRINENRHYMADELLKRKCVVRVERLSETILSRYSRALRKSRDYVESKNLKRLVALNTLDKDQKKVNIDSSDDEDNSSLKNLKHTKTKSRGAKDRKETLLDHLNKVNNGEDVALSCESDAENSTIDNKEEDKDKSDDRLLTEANRMAKKRLLESSDSGADEEPVADANDEETKKSKKVVKKEKSKKSSEDEEKKEKDSEKSSWRRNKLLTSKISDSDSEEELKKFNMSQEKLKETNKGSQSESNEETTPKKKKKRVRRRVLHSDSDVIISSDKSESDSDSSVQSIKKKKKKGESSDDEKDKKKTRKRTRRGRGSSDSSDSLDERPKPTRRKRIKKTGSDSDSDQDSSQGSPGKSGRKNIRKVLRDKQVAEDTKQAAKEEEERLKRIAERQKLYNEMYEVRLAGEEKVDKLVLDFDEETKEPLVSVDEGLVKRLKPHQAQGIKFMWDACFESLERMKSTKGSGCILAHCMGLGKSFQVVTLAHTLLTHEETGIKTVLVVCPLSTVLNWANEFKIWLADIDDADDIEIYEMTKMKKDFERKFQLARWQETGGVMIIGYEMFRNLTQQTGKKVRKKIQETFLKCLVDPGPDLIVCDEGHLLKNEDTALSKAMRRVKTLRRVVLTGTPLQNNLIEYHCMVQFVKPNLLGTKKEFMNRFENPITNGQFDDSTEYDVKLMKKRAHILHKLLEGSVQRFDYSVLTPFLPPKQEYVIFVKLTKIQIDMYQHYLDNYARKHRGVGGSLFADFQALQRIWTHPMVMQMNAEKVEKANEKKRLDASDSEGSLRDFIDDGSDTPCTSSDSDIVSDDEKNKKTKRSTRANPVAEEPIEEAPAATEDSANNTESQWWSQYVKEEDYEDIKCSSKLLILFRIIKESEQIGDKLLVFSQSLYSLSLIEKFLELIDEETQKGNEPENLDGHSGSWALGLDYFRLDGQTSADNRRRWCDIFNKPSNTRARLFLISTRAGGLGINLTAANRVVIFDASWNPSHDVQSIFRIYRFGQKKPCYVYRLLAAGTMEEKIYNRQVTKLSLSCRVVDEQQIERHYSNNALAELYKLELPSETEKTLNLPKDRLLAEIFLKYKYAVENYHEHDSLLENQAGEELDEEERKQAWLEYEDEKKGKRIMPPMTFGNYQDPMLMQQINIMNMGQQNALNNPAMLADFQNLKRLMEKDYPGIPEAQQRIMAQRAVYDMYNYVEKQAMASQGGMHLPNMGAIQTGYNNPFAQTVNTGQTYMDILRLQQIQQQQQQQQKLIQQQNGQIKFANTQQQLRADILRQQQQLYGQQMQSQAQSSATSSITIDDDDIMEVTSSPEKNSVPPAAVPDANPKNKEE